MLKKTNHTLPSICVKLLAEVRHWVQTSPHPFLSQKIGMCRYPPKPHLPPPPSKPAPWGLWCDIIALPVLEHTETLHDYLCWWVEQFKLWVGDNNIVLLFLKGREKIFSCISTNSIAGVFTLLMTWGAKRYFCMQNANQWHSPGYRYIYLCAAQCWIGLLPIF